MNFAELLQLSLFSQILSSMGDHDDCVSFVYYYASLVIAILFNAITCYMFMIMYYLALTAAFTSANDIEANSAPNIGIGHNTGLGSNTSFGHTTGHALGFGRHSDATTDQVALVSGTGSNCHATLAYSQNSDPITVQAIVGSSLNSDHSTGHVLGSSRSSGAALGSSRRADAALGSGRSSDATLSFYSGRSSIATLGSGRSFDATLGSSRSSDATLSSGKNSDFITIHATAGSDLNSEPSTNHALGSSGLSDATLGFDTNFGQNSETSTGHALGFDRPCDPTIDHATLVTGTDSSRHTTLDSGPSSGPTIAIAASCSIPSFSPTIVHVASCNTPTCQATFSKNPTAAFFNATPSSSSSDDEAH